MDKKKARSLRQLLSVLVKKFLPESYVKSYMYHLIFIPRKQSLGIYRNRHAPVEIHLRGLKFSPSITYNIIVHVCPDIYMYKITKCSKTRWFNYQYHLKGLWCKKTVVIKKTNMLVSCYYYSNCKRSRKIYTEQKII